MHWTITWREEILGDRYRGSATLDIWGNTFDQVDGIVRNLQYRLKTNRALLKQKGFIQLQPMSLNPVENVLHDTPAGSPFSVWKQKLGYRFVFEAEDGGELSSGVPIQEINIEMREEVSESFSVP
jgi:hypothetical protein